MTAERSLCRRGSRLRCAGGLVVLLALLPGCDREPIARVLSAEFLDETPDGKMQPGETILLRLDRPLPAAIPADAIQVRSRPPSAWTGRPRRSADDPRRVEIAILSRQPSLLLEGVHGEDPGATGLVVSLGDGVDQVLDLQSSISIPRLERAIWEDLSPAGSSGLGGGGNGIVDRGDRIRLVFDQPVCLAAGALEHDLQVPRDILLSKDSVDRLDDGVVPSRLLPGEEENEVFISLGSRPVLNVAGVLPEVPAKVDRFRLDAPSGIALNGTEILPFPWVTGRRGGTGSASTGEIDIELAPSFPAVRRRPSDALPEPGPREFHTVTPLAGAYAVIAGGRSLATGEPLDDLLLYHPFHERLGEEPYIRRQLPRAAYRHSATLMRGSGGLPVGLDSYVVIAGGTDGRSARDDLAVVRISARGALTVQPLAARLRAARYDHAAAAVGPNRILIDGGRTIGGSGEEMLVGCAELITFDLVPGPDSQILRVAEHAVFRTIERCEHSLTPLRAADGRRWALAYGGLGRDRNRHPLAPFEEIGTLLGGDGPAPALFPAGEASVLVSPVLLAVDDPPSSIADLEYAMHASLLRRGHAAAAWGGDVDQDISGPAEVLIAGGTLAHPEKGFEGEIPALWEIPPRSLYWLEWRRRPDAQDAIHGIRLRFNPESPRESRLDVVLHAATDPTKVPTRVHAAASFVPGLGLLLAGGEIPGPGGERQMLSTVEVFLPEEGRIVPYSLQLLEPRSRHQAYLLQDDGRRSLLVIGGRTASPDGAASADVEEIPLPDRLP
ncbi:MAG: hypothetical protein JXA90_06755 [Planctomycetes bacterium]|nr:hypothetical protein [Planctomycetota bacterium]